jgi:hypothetical protein
MKILKHGQERLFENDAETATAYGPDIKSGAPIA